MDKFTITIKDACVYPLIEADTQEKAIKKALEWWNERMPNIQVTIHKNCHFHCPVNAWDCPYFSHTEKEPCLCSLENPMKDCDDFASCWDADDEYWDEDEA